MADAEAGFQIEGWKWKIGKRCWKFRGNKYGFAISSLVYECSLDSLGKAFHAHDCSVRGCGELPRPYVTTRNK